MKSTADSDIAQNILSSGDAELGLHFKFNEFPLCLRGRTHGITGVRLAEFPASSIKYSSNLSGV